MLDEGAARFLCVGIMLQFIFPGEGEELQCSATLLGWKDNAFLISELPHCNGRPIDVLVEAPVVVRCLLEGRMVGYRTEVRALQLTPEPLLFLTFPVKIEQIVLRKNPRVFLQQPISLIRGAARPSVVTGVMKDLSSAGCRVELPSGVDFAAGAAIRTEFALPGVGHISNLIGLVKNVATHSGRTILGIEFQFHQMEFIEFHGWGGTVKKAIEQFVLQRQRPVALSEEVWR